MEKISFLKRKVAHNFTVWAIVLFSTFWAKEAFAHDFKSPTASFGFFFDYVERISDYHNQHPNMEFVYGDPTLDEPGFLVVIEPHPENAWNSPSHILKVSNNDFRIWIDAEQKDATGKKIFCPLFTKDGQSLQYLDVHRKNKSAFALFISQDEFSERIPRIGIDSHKAPYYEFRLNFNFARSLTARYPTEFAEPVDKKQQYLDFYGNPGTYYLKNKVEWVDEAHVYMEQHPEKKYFFNYEQAWNAAGWFFNLSYKRKYEIKSKVNDSHYVILTLWKDKEHTKPLNIYRLKNSLIIGSSSIYPEEMADTVNYIAFPHEGFEDWALLIPWSSINYWERDGIKATKDNHICYGYYTLTLSNDGVTPAADHSYDYSGYVSLDFEVPKTKPVCNHVYEKKVEDCGPYSVYKGDGCTEDFEKYAAFKKCKKCGETRDYNFHFVRVNDNGKHSCKEINRIPKGTITILCGVDGNTTVRKNIWEVTYECQDWCCHMKYTIDEIEENISSTPQDRKEIEENISNTPQDRKEIEDNISSTPQDKEEKPQIITPIPVKECPPHEDFYFSEDRFLKGYTTEIKEPQPPYDGDSLVIPLDSTTIEMIRTDSYTYLSLLPATRKQWRDIYRDNNYMGFIQDDMGLLNGVTYQTAIDFIAKLNDRQSDKETGILFSLPSVDEMRIFLSQHQPCLEQYEAPQPINSFYVDSIEVYDGKGRKVTEEQLSTAPEGANLRVLVGCMNRNGEVKMVEFTSRSKETVFYLKVQTSPMIASKTHTTPGKSYRIYYRKCKKCRRIERISEQIFHNMKYHRPIIDNYQY